MKLLMIGLSYSIMVYATLFTIAKTMVAVTRVDDSSKVKMIKSFIHPIAVQIALVYAHMHWISVLFLYVIIIGDFIIYTNLYKSKMVAVQLMQAASPAYISFAITLMAYHWIGIKISTIVDKTNPVLFVYGFLFMFVFVLSCTLNIMNIHTKKILVNINDPDIFQGFKLLRNKIKGEK